MPIDPRTAPQNIDRFLNENLGPINRFLERIMSRPSAEEAIKKQVDRDKPSGAPFSYGVGKPGAPTLTQQAVQGILLALSAGRVGAFRRGPPEFPITTRTYTDPRSGQTFQVPGYDTSRSATHPHEFTPKNNIYKAPENPYQPPRHLDRQNAALHREYSNYNTSELNDIASQLRTRYTTAVSQYNKLQQEINKNPGAQQLIKDQKIVLDEIDDLLGRIRVAEHRANTSDILRNANHNTHVYRGMEFDYGRFDRGPRGPEGGGPQSKPPVTSSEINDIMQSFGYSRYRDQRGTRGTRGGTDTDYLWYRSNTPDLPLQHKDPSTGLSMAMPASRFLFRIGDHPAARSAAKQNRIDPARFYDVSPGSNFKDVEAIRRHLAQRLGVNLPEPPQRTPIPANQLDLFRDYIQGR